MGGGGGRSLTLCYQVCAYLPILVFSTWCFWSYVLLAKSNGNQSNTNLLFWLIVLFVMPYRYLVSWFPFVSQLHARRTTWLYVIKDVLMSLSGKLSYYVTFVVRADCTAYSISRYCLWTKTMLYSPDCCVWVMIQFIDGFTGCIYTTSLCLHLYMYR